MKKHTGSYHFVPNTATYSIKGNLITLQELAEIVCNLSFDRPDSLINYSIEVMPMTEESAKK